MFCQKRDRVLAAGLWAGIHVSAAAVLLLVLTATAVDLAGAFGISGGMGGVTTGGAGIGRGGFGGGAPKKRRQVNPSPFPAGWRADRKAPRPLKQRPQPPTKQDAAGEGAAQTKAARQQAGPPPAAVTSPATGAARHATTSIDDQIRQAKRVRAQREHAKAPPPPSPAASRVDVAALFRPPRQDLLDGMLSESGGAATVEGQRAASVDVARASVRASAGALDNEAPPVTTPANDATSEVPPVTSAAVPASDGPQAPAPAVAETPESAPAQPTAVATPPAGAEQKLPKDLGAAIRDAARKAKLQRQAREAAEAEALAEAQEARRSHAQALMDGRDDGQGVSTGAVISPPSVEQPLQRVPDASVEPPASAKSDEPLEPATSAAPDPPKEAPRPSNNDL